MYRNYTSAGKGITSVTALDKWTVEVKVPPAYQNMLFFNISDHYFYYSPDPVLEGLDLDDWRNVCGTGPYMLTEYIPNTSQYYTKNPDYYMVDPLHPENHLPYANLRVLVIPDASTTMAGFRTGKLDFLKGASWEDGELLIKHNSELQYVRKPKYAYSTLCGRTDKEDLPFRDIRVRQALNLAVDNQEMVDVYFEGNADLLGYPCADVKDMEPYYVPLEEQPAAVQELFTYNPEKAIALLAEAGYPDGFKTQVVCRNDAKTVDLLSIIREYFLKVNVDMEISPVEGSVFSGISMNRSHEAMIYTATKASTPYELYFERLDSTWNVSFWHDDRIDEAYTQISAVVGKDDAEVGRIMKEITPLILEQSWGIWLPAEYDYFIWWPWLQNCHGEWGCGNLGADRHWKYFWKDEALRESMGY
jgi:peptide/nickel transport system substrate-binding protein